MDLLSPPDLERDAAAFDAAALATPGIDAFCSGAAWALAALEAFPRPGEPRIWRDSEAYCAFLCTRSAAGREIWMPFETVWGLGSPIVGPRGSRPEALFARALDTSPRGAAVLIAGVPAGGEVLRAILAELGAEAIGGGAVTRRLRASLEGGLDGFLGRRSPGFRRGVSRALRQAREAGVAYEHLRVGDPGAGPAPIYARIQAVEERSWKGRARSGINVGGMRRFYARMLELLAPRRTASVLFARCGDRDVGYLLGARCGTLFRALQCSYDAEGPRIGIGNLLQYESIARLCEAGSAGVYDLGTEQPYKRRWAEESRDTVTLLLGRPVT